MKVLFNFSVLITINSYLITKTCRHDIDRRLFQSKESKIIQHPKLDHGLKFNAVPDTDLIVSQICLGTMTFGEQVDKDGAFRQLDLAMNDFGINFMDTAEIYPIPPNENKMGLSETIVGEWIKKQSASKRDELVISAKICGFSDEITWCRKNSVGTRINREQVFEAVDAQLKRLGRDHIDILQFHWPDRYVPLFGAPEYDWSMENGHIATSIQEQLSIITDLIKSGRIRYFGLSNETPFGLSDFIRSAEFYGFPEAKPRVLQNAYNLLERNDYENGMKEICSPKNGNVGLLAYSPLAGGALSGKYVEEGDYNPKVIRELTQKLLDARTRNENCRMRKYVGYMHRYVSAPANEAITSYLEVAEWFGLPLATIALAYVYTRPFVTSTIIGATSLQQLEDNILALNIPVTPEMDTLINNIYRKNMDPTKGRFPVYDPKLLDTYVDPSNLPWGSRDADVDGELEVLMNLRKRY